MAAPVARSVSSQPMRLRVGQLASHCGVLGPGDRFAVWVQGCPLACQGCVSPDLQRWDGGAATDVTELSERVAAEAVDGITISGGEPFSQSLPLARLLHAIGLRRPELTVLCYSGYTLGQLLRRFGDSAKRLLRCVDCLIDGPYDLGKQLSPPLRWRGSSNQRVHLFTQRVRHWAPLFAERGVWLEVEAESTQIGFRGIPPPGFAEDFRRVAASGGVTLGMPVSPTDPGKGESA